MSDSDLIVDDKLLVKTAKSLKKIQYEFEHTEEHQDDLKGVWGSGQIAGAMDDFADNWDYHRKQLLESIKTVGELAEGCHQAFKDLDQKLAKATQPSHSNGGGK
ncbi:hypothetical protein [Streptomyces sp. NBC_01236]|uniref:hypothetical protein n=1 Tax=Streptomyces sp. NBC_01236 TaxID=2903789 RepID=UPI002E166439|nr:hypothetical protein OG324_19060 [Streptomyces sp. NBC_01236]